MMSGREKLNISIVTISMSLKFVAVSDSINGLIGYNITDSTADSRKSIFTKYRVCRGI